MYNYQHFNIGHRTLEELYHYNNNNIPVQVDKEVSPLVH